jgi:D-threo-aldose 1-dehydrogenase
VEILFAHDLDVFTHGSWEKAEQYLKAFMASGYYALLSLRDQGVIKAFGAGINEYRPAQWLTERGDFDLFLLAGRYTLLEQESLETFLPLCEKRGIGIVLGGPYNSGILATGPVKGAYYNYDAAPQAIMDKVGRIEKVCERHKVRLIEAALRFPLHHKSVVSVIPGGQSVAQVESNSKVLAAKIPNGLWADLKSRGLMRTDAPTP